MSLCSRIQFFIITSLINGIAVYAIVNPDFEYYPVAIGSYFGILLPFVYFRLEALQIDIRTLVLGLTPFTLFMLCLGLTFAPAVKSEQKRVEYITLE